MRKLRAALESYAAMKRIPSPLPRLFLIIFLDILGLLQIASAQNNSPQNSLQKDDTAPPPPITAIPASNNNSGQQASSPAPAALVIGPGDELDIAVYGAPDLSGHMRVSANGNISIPLVGYVRVAGLGSSEAEAAIEAQLRDKSIVNDPQVSVYVKEYGSSGISVAGEVAKPGFYSVLGPHRLLDVLQVAGGPTERASNRVFVSHRGQKDVTTFTLSRDPAEMAASNVDLQPGDTVVVPRAGIVYVLGEGTKPGFQEQQIDLKKLLRGRIHDVALRDEDILYVPSSGVKTALNASALVAVAASTAIYRVPF